MRPYKGDRQQKIHSSRAASELTKEQKTCLLAGGKMERIPLLSMAHQSGVNALRERRGRIRKEHIRDTPRIPCCDESRILFFATVIIIGYQCLAEGNKPGICPILQTGKLKQ